MAYLGEPVILNDESTAADNFLTYVNATSGRQELRTDSGLKYNPATKTLTVGRLDLTDAFAISIDGGTTEGVDLYTLDGAAQALDIAAGTGIEIASESGKVTISSTGATAFTNLTDAPDVYTGQAGKAVIVKATEDGLEFGTVAGGGGGPVGVVNAMTGSATIPIEGWVAIEGDYSYKLDLVIDGIVADSSVTVAIDKNNQEAAVAAGLCPVNDSYDGGITLYAQFVPEAIIEIDYMHFVPGLTGIIIGNIDGGSPDSIYSNGEMGLEQLIPVGGEAGQVLGKINGADYEVAWIDMETGSAAVNADWNAAEGTAAEILNKPALFVPYTDGGLLVEDFEDTDYAIPFIGIGARVTTNKHSGTYGYRCWEGNVPLYATQAVTFTLNVASDGELSLWYKRNGEASGYNPTVFTLDGIVVLNDGATATPWTKFTTPITAGTHEFIISHTAGGATMWVNAYIDELSIPAPRQYTQSILEHNDLTSPLGNGGKLLALNSGGTAVEYVDKPASFAISDGKNLLVESFEDALAVIPVSTVHWNKVDGGRTGLKAFSSGSGGYGTLRVATFTLNVEVAGTLSFWYKAINEANGAGGYYVKLDGTPILSSAANISAWTEVAVPITPGTHTLECAAGIHPSWWNILTIDDLSIPKLATYNQGIFEHSNMSSPAGNGGKLLALKSDMTGVEYVDKAISNVKADWNAVDTEAEILNKPTIPSTLLALSDTPDVFTAQAGKALIVNEAENALEFGTVASEGGSATMNSVFHTSVVTLTEEASTFAIGIAEFNSATDKILIYQGGIYKSIPEEITVTSTTATKVSGTWAAGTSFDILVIKQTTSLMIGNINGGNATSTYVEQDVSAGLMPTGGTTGQVLVKNSGTNYDADWINGESLIYANPLDKPPASPSTWDDDFNSPTLNAKWAWLNQGSNTYDLAAVEGHIKMSKLNEEVNVRSLVQNRPSGDFSVMAKMVDEFCDTEAYAGIVLINSTTGNHVTAGLRSGLMGQTGYTNFTGNQPHDYATYGSYATYVWVKVKVVGNTAYFYYSSNGILWKLKTSFAVPTDFDKIGIGVQNGMSGCTCVVYFDWFRVTQA
jgi:hypothetical protein